MCQLYCRCLPLIFPNKVNKLTHFISYSASSAPLSGRPNVIRIEASERARLQMIHLYLHLGEDECAIANVFFLQGTMNHVLFQLYIINHKIT